MDDTNNYTFVNSLGTGQMHFVSTYDAENLSIIAKVAANYRYHKTTLQQDASDNNNLISASVGGTILNVGKVAKQKGTDIWITN